MNYFSYYSQTTIPFLSSLVFFTIPYIRIYRALRERQEYDIELFYISKVYLRTLIVYSQIFVGLFYFDRIIKIGKLYVFIPFYTFESLNIAENIRRTIKKMRNGQQYFTIGLFYGTMFRILCVMVLLSSLHLCLKCFLPLFYVIFVCFSKRIPIQKTIVCAAPLFLYLITISCVVNNLHRWYVFLPLAMPYLIIMLSFLYGITYFLRNIPLSSTLPLNMLPSV